MSDLQAAGASAPSTARPALPDAAARRRLRRWRGVKDLVARYGVALGGYSVIGALALIFVYLMSEVVPMFRAASITPVASYTVPGTGPAQTAYLAMDRHREVGTRFSPTGQVTFFVPDTGRVLAEHALPVPQGVEVVSVAAAEPRTGLLAFGLSDGRAVVVQYAYDISYPDDVRQVSPRLDFPLGEEPVVVDEGGAALVSLAVQEGTRGTTVAAVTADRRLLLVQYTATTSFMTGETVTRRASYVLPAPPASATRLLVDGAMRNLYVGDAEGMLHYYDVSNPAQARLVDSRRVLTREDASVTALEFVLGTVSIIVGGSEGSVSQWFLVRGADNLGRLAHVRSFPAHGAAVTTIVPEHARKGFATADAEGEVALHYPTSARTVLRQRLAEAPIAGLAIAPRNNGLFVLEADNTLQYHRLSNPHPEISFSALWRKVWYEGRGGPDYVWQSSSATDEFEPKFSLVPLSLGTLKAAFYAMLFAMPLAIMGAIYTAYFMSPKMRGAVKPTIEIMEALPTVILGFLAGLWLAPFLENHLPAVFSVLLLMPLGMLALAFGWTRLPAGLRHAIPGGWEAALLIPVVLAVGWVSVQLSPLLEVWFFDGSMRQWLTDVGITYDQRNAMVVGIAMGFAVIPTIFSIAEDAIFNVPKHLTQGSLALGATPWQTVTRVVLLTASPGIFSAVMIGFGRAVGETMIVLMATGNSPIVNFNIFEGMRTLSANIAVEMPETAVGSSHFRILFLAALVLFALTFLVNTVAEVVRQRMRRKYAAL
ncbi:ABC transporter permease subunit [Ectothiorhodospiraceae bacterium 2226]|nr:ABC transporter permease subunit [Ectothiorhodospiraceae bacterium 2226]